MKYIVFSFALALFIFSLFGFTPSGSTSKTPTPEATEEVQLLIEADEGPIEFIGFEVNEARFNPNADRPAALNIMSSLDFKNISGGRLEVRYPRLTLKINGVEWTDLASTDFQIGRLQAGAVQGIELQSLLIVRRATDEQKEILETIKQGMPVDLEISGTIQVYPQGKEQTLNVTITLNEIVLPGEWER